MPDPLDTNAKALRLNLDHAAYGTFAEIGGGQEVSRWFFRVGGAAGTVAKTMSAYDMKVSDAIYGGGERYVSRERLRSMLTHEYDLLVERLNEPRGETTNFFAFADTVATRSFKGGNEAHGWMGLRFQDRPRAVPSEMVLHVALRDPTAELQQQSLGVLGVNLLHAAYYQRASFKDLLRGLFDKLTLANLAVDVVECAGPAFEGSSDPRSIALGILELGLTEVVVFDENGQMDQPSTVFRKRALLVHRCSMHRDNPQLDRMVKGSTSLLAKEGINSERGALPVLELCVAGPDGKPAAPSGELRLRTDRLFRPGYAVMLTTLTETFRASMYLREVAKDPVRFVLGLDAVVTVLRNSFYKAVDGGMLEGLGRLLGSNTKLYVFPMSAMVFRERLAMHDVEAGFCTTSAGDMLGVDDISLTPPAKHLLEFLKSAGWLIGGELGAGVQ